MSARWESRDSSRETSRRTRRRAARRARRAGPCRPRRGRGARGRRGACPRRRRRPACGAKARTASSGSQRPATMQWPVSSASASPGTASARRAQSSQSSTSIPGSGSTAQVTPRRRARRRRARRRRATPSTRRGQAGLGHAGPERHGLAAELGGDVDAACAGRPAGAPGPRRRRRPAWGSCLRRGSSRNRAPVSTTLPRPSPSRRRPQRGGAGGQVRRERVEVADVEGERDAVVAAVGEQRERVVEAVAGQAVGVVGVAEHHRTALLPSTCATTCRPGSR